MRLAAASPRPRIVTTNYDRLLTLAADELKLDLSLHEAPYLPPGDDFHGLVHIHGSVDQEGHHLVVTDSDLGRAYLGDGWATRFLRRMFTRYSVLFIGYSHNDVLISYLGQSLLGSHNRVALTDKAEPRHWQRLGIASISYPNPDDDHAALTEIIESWASWASMKPADHALRVRDLTSCPPPQSRDDLAYLERVIAEPSTVDFFSKYARGREWLDWIANRPEFARLFAADCDNPQVTRALANWFVYNFAVEEDHTAAALAAVARWDIIGQSC